MQKDSIKDNPRKTAEILGQWSVDSKVLTAKT